MEKKNQENNYFVPLLNILQPIAGEVVFLLPLFVRPKSQISRKG